MGLGSIAFPLIRANGFVRMAKYIIKRNIVKGRGYCVQKIYLRSINGVTLYLYTSYFPTSDVNTKSKSLCNRSMYRVLKYLLSIFFVLFYSWLMAYLRYTTGWLFHTFCCHATAGLGRPGRWLYLNTDRAKFSFWSCSE